MAEGTHTIQLMNEHSVDVPLWDDEGLMDADELGLSPQLFTDLAEFGRRWNDAVDPEVFDDRWDGNPVMSRV